MIAVGARPIFETEVVKLDPGGFAELGTEWQSLEDRARGVSPYTSFAWLDAWLRAYSPPDPAVLRVRARDGDTIALGLVERRSGRRWAFGGEPVTSERGLLCAADLDADAWQAVRTWLRAERRRWATLDCGAAPSAALVLPNARTSEISLLRMPLPDSFEHYLAARTAKRRWALKRKLKALEDAGGPCEGQRVLRSVWRTSFACTRNVPAQRGSVILRWTSVSRRCSSRWQQLLHQSS